MGGMGGQEKIVAKRCRPVQEDCQQAALTQSAGLLPAPSLTCHMSHVEAVHLTCGLSCRLAAPAPVYLGSLSYFRDMRKTP